MSEFCKYYSGQVLEQGRGNEVQIMRMTVAEGDVELTTDFCAVEAVALKAIAECSVGDKLSKSVLCLVCNKRLLLQMKKIRSG